MAYVTTETKTTSRYVVDRPNSDSREPVFIAFRAGLELGRALEREGVSEEEVKITAGYDVNLFENVVTVEGFDRHGSKPLPSLPEEGMLSDEESEQMPVEPTPGDGSATSEPAPLRKIRDAPQA